MKSNKENTYNNATSFYKDDTPDNIDTSKCGSDVWYDSFGSDPLRAWDSTSMINHPQHFRNQRSNINSHLQLHQHMIDPLRVSSPLAKLGIFKPLGSPVPFRPNSKTQPLYALTPHTALTTSEQMQHHHPRLPPMQPIYNVKGPMTAEQCYNLDDPLGRSNSNSNINSNININSNSNYNNVISITSSTSNSRVSNNENKNGIDTTTYRWQPNYQFHPGILLHHDDDDIYEHKKPQPSPLTL
ncbi:hypothetical protein BCR42DRAFT_423243 [Absidia repens]|uniref:Uncharacterized protein n=1 Tax=Absidia repens TaxID=90262 RepID=A0A1X2I735_9FUNG|nr:hypothetical protein BCR42DRAFT_423243 [Absidia repens]